MLLWNRFGLRSPLEMTVVLAAMLLALGLLTEHQLPLCRRVMRRAGLSRSASTPESPNQRITELL